MKLEIKNQKIIWDFISIKSIDNINRFPIYNGWVFIDDKKMVRFKLFYNKDYDGKVSYILYDIFDLSNYSNRDFIKIIRYAVSKIRVPFIKYISCKC